MLDASIQYGGLTQSGRRAKRGGAVLMAASLLEILAMAHHPSVAAPDIARALGVIAEFSRRAAWVHGALICLMLVILHELSEFALRRDLRRTLVRAGLLGYCVGVIAMLGAALVSGWVVANLAASTRPTTAMDLQITGQLLILCGVLNRACANLGVVAMSAGIGLWSLDLLRDPGIPRIAGVLGGLVCVLPAVALFGGALHLDVVGMGEVILLQAVWNIAIGAMLMLERVRAASYR
jgi:hypothetical protein